MWAAVKSGEWSHVLPVIEIDERRVDKSEIGTAEDTFLAAAPPHVLTLDCPCHPTLNGSFVLHEEVN